MDKYIVENFDISEYMEDINSAIVYLNQALEDDEPSLIFLALADVIKKQIPITKLSKETGISRKGLYKMLSGDGNPSYLSLVKILKSLNLKFSINTM